MFAVAAATSADNSDGCDADDDVVAVAVVDMCGMPC